MLYKTHKKFGYVFGYIALILSFINGWLVSVNQVRGFHNQVMVFLLVYTAIRGSVFGASFPDIDSKGSVPARHYPFLRRVFKAFNIKHRGHVSHDYVSITIIFGATLYGVQQLLKFGNTNKWVMLLLSIYVCYNFSRDILNNVIFHLVRDKQKRRVYLRVLKPLLAVVIYVVFIFLGFIRLGVSPSSLVATSNFVAPILRVWIIFGWVGSISHLFADMLTNDGVHFLGFDIAPAKIVLLVKKLPFIGKHLLANNMKTGSSYEDGWNLIVTVLIVPLFILVVFGVFGGDVQGVLSMIGS